MPSRQISHAEALARNSQVINAMGMLNESILHWGREQDHVPDPPDRQRSTATSGSAALSKYFRLITQIVSRRARDAYLALDGRLTAA